MKILLVIFLSLSYLLAQSYSEKIILISLCKDNNFIIIVDVKGKKTFLTNINTKYENSVLQGNLVTMQDGKYVDTGNRVSFEIEVIDSVEVIEKKIDN